MEQNHGRRGVGGNVNRTRHPTREDLPDFSAAKTVAMITCSMCGHLMPKATALDRLDQPVPDRLGLVRRVGGYRAIDRGTPIPLDSKDDVAAEARQAIRRKAAKILSEVPQD